MASLLLAVLVVVTLIVVLKPGTGGGVPTRLSIAWAVIGTTWAVTGIASNLLTIRVTGAAQSSTADLTKPVLIKEDAFVDRIVEIGELGPALMSSRCVNCYGQTGSGKSHLLGFVADVINGHRPAETLRPLPSDISAALYFDLADTVGFDQLEKHICSTAYPDTSSWSQVVQRIDQDFGNDRVVLILDNVNASAMWQRLGSAVYQYLAERPSDSVVLGSVDPIVFHNLENRYLKVALFDHEAVSALVAVRDPSLTANEVKELHERTGGLPVYLQLVLANSDRPDGMGAETPVGSFMRERVLPKLEEPTQDLVARIAVLAFAHREIGISELAEAPIANLESEIERAASRSLIAVPNRGSGRVVRMHDVVRDEIVRLLPSQTQDAAGVLLERAMLDDDKTDACLFALFCNPAEVDTEIADLIVTVIDQAVSEHNYPLLETIWQGVNANAPLMTRMRDRIDVIAYARAFALAGVGEYAAAESALLSSPTPPARDPAPGTRAFDIQYLLADVTHLQNRYDEALEMFRHLETTAIAAKNPVAQARTVWGQGHVLRHQGRDFEAALERFETATRLARTSGSLGIETLAVTNSTGLKAYLQTIPPDELDVLADLEKRLEAAGAGPSEMVKVWKGQARVAWLLDYQNTARSLIDNSIDAVLAINDRGVYNLYFEKAEFARLSGRTPEALLNYQRVLEFAKENGDRNLVANALLGLAACGTKESNDSRSTAELRGDVLEARQIAAEADIQATVKEAEAMIDKLNTPAIESLRFIVF